MKKVFKTPDFKIYLGESLAGEKAVWLSLHGNSYVRLAGHRKDLNKSVLNLRKAVDWIERNAPKYLESITTSR